MGALGPSETRTFWTILEQSYLLLPSTMVRVSYRACHTRGRSDWVILALRAWSFRIGCCSLLEENALCDVRS